MRSKPDIDGRCREVAIDDHITGIQGAPAAPPLVASMAALPLKLPRGCRRRSTQRYSLPGNASAQVRFARLIARRSARPPHVRPY